ncbi:glucosamine-6-phosphate deaminase [Subtercola lobariae]|uniref:Glucosamine-6-phosphate deaminase n=1 Tax=Subtercola lobariae TaxID=1588641 RepID=A0A917BB51_9MICO|nr:glucosamine-6-phosphate deaminase [Subtercola lobariae]GGF29486.1 glucosamine-6-phosphate deaminase [Subtercola lobariae]
MAEVVIVANAAEAGHLAADAIVRLIARKPTAVLGLATGSTPLSTYAALAERAAASAKLPGTKISGAKISGTNISGAETLDLSRVRGFALDEYLGLPPGHPQSYRTVITREVVEPLGLTPTNIHVPNGSAEAAATAGDDYERAIVAAGGIDLQILGIGTDGHIGFNEPGSSFASLTRVKTLTEQTRRDNARFFETPDAVPMHCVTQGLGTILRARHLVLLAYGPAKAAAVAAAVEGPLTASQPASVIQLHAHATVIVDEQAAAALANADYYRHAWQNRPSWQQL